MELGPRHGSQLGCKAKTTISWKNSGFTVDSARGENIPRRELGLANRVAATTRGDTTAEGAPQDWPTEIRRGWGGAGAIDRSALRGSGVCVLRLQEQWLELDRAPSRRAAPGSGSRGVRLLGPVLWTRWTQAYQLPRWRRRELTWQRPRVSR